PRRGCRAELHHDLGNVIVGEPRSGEKELTGGERPRNAEVRGGFAQERPSRPGREIGQRWRRFPHRAREYQPIRRGGELALEGLELPGVGGGGQRELRPGRRRRRRGGGGPPDARPGPSSAPASAAADSVTSVPDGGDAGGTSGAPTNGSRKGRFRCTGPGGPPIDDRVRRRTRSCQVCSSGTPPGTGASMESRTCAPNSPTCSI